MAVQLEADGYLLTDQEYQTLRLTPKSSEVLYHGNQVRMLVRRELDTASVLGPAVANLTYEGIPAPRPVRTA